MSSASGTYQAVGLRLLGGSTVRRPTQQATTAVQPSATTFSKPPPTKIPNRLITLWLLSIAGFAFLTACAEIFGG